MVDTFKGAEVESSAMARLADRLIMTNVVGSPANFEVEGSSPLPEPADLLSDPIVREQFELTSAALEAAELVRVMRRQAFSATGMQGITQDELAQRTGLSQPRISQIENGSGRDGVSYSVLRKIAFACGINWGQALREAIQNNHHTRDPT